MKQMEWLVAVFIYPAIPSSVKNNKFPLFFNVDQDTRETSIQRVWEEIWTVTSTVNWTVYRTLREFRESAFAIFYLPMFNENPPIMTA